MDTVLGLPDWPVHLVIASRSQPPLAAIARLRIEGRLVELDEADLRFTPDEARSFMAAGGLALQEAEMRQIVERTEGWPAALQLVRQAAQRADRPDLPAILGRIGDERPLFDYLAGQVLAHQPPAVQDFLRRTSLLPYLSAELCNAYLHITNAAALLDGLEREHLFIVRVAEAQGRPYRYDAFFQEFLQRCLEHQEGGAAMRAWHCGAATCLLANQAALPQQRLDDQAAAVEHLLAAHDWTAAAQVIATLADALDFGSLPQLEPWFAHLPAEVLAVNPRLLVAQGQLRERQGRWAEALTALQQAERAAQSAGSMAELTRAYRWQAWVYFRQDRYAESIALCQRALAIAPTDNAEELAAVYNIPIRVQRHLGHAWGKSYSEQSSLLARGNWYPRVVQCCAIGHWQHGRISLRRTAEFLSSWLGRQGRWRLWRLLEVPPSNEACYWAASTLSRWLDQAGMVAVMRRLAGS